MNKKEKLNNEHEELKDQEVTSDKQDETGEAGKGKEKSKSPKKRKLSKAEQLEELTYQYTELNDKYLRLFSDFDNYRKRTNKEKIDLIATASVSVIEGLLPVLDDLDRALQSFTEQDVNEETVHGVELIYNKLFNYLKQKGLEPMDSKGKDFDTDYHDAIAHMPAPEDDLKGKVIDVTQKGYLLNGTIIRHAKVVVGQ